MEFGRRVSWETVPGRNGRRRYHRGLLGLAVLIACLTSVVPASAPRAGDDTAFRAVRSSSSFGERALAPSTASLYPKNDPWRSYLANERTCPGGERTDLPVTQQVQIVSCLINFARRHRGLRELPVVSVLNGASARKARAMVRCGNFEHNPCGGDWQSAVRSAGYNGAFGENLYLATGRFGAPRVAVDAWLNSDSHRLTLFSRQWREQGVALVPRARFGAYRNVSLWVSVLGDP